MSYEQLTLKSPSLLRRFSHRSRYALAIRLLDPRPGDRILDYGAGDAELLVQLSEIQGPLHLAAYEPTPWCNAEAIEKTRHIRPEVIVAADFSQLRGFAPNKVACLEVLEHLPSEKLDETLRRLSSLAQAGAQILVSVPIEIGPPALLKYFVRSRGDHAHRRSLREIGKSLAGRTDDISREPQDGYISSHFGFDFRKLTRQFEQQGLQVRREVCSPLPMLGRWFNSQMFYVLGAAG